MRFAALPLLICLFAPPAWAGEISSLYTKFDLTKCKPARDEAGKVLDSAWRCKGIGGIDIFQAEGDLRSYVGFGKSGTCAARKTFQRFNSALSPVEWRIKNDKPFAAIERWSVSTDDEGGEATWLVVTALRKGDACHVHYVSGAYPNANQAARRAADTLAADFDCDNDKAGFDSATGPPPIDFSTCGELQSD